MRDPDCVFTVEGAGVDKIVVDALFGGVALPFRVVIHTDREGVMETCAMAFKAKAREFDLWDEEKEPWEASTMVMMLKDGLNNIGEVQTLSDFRYGTACRLCVYDKTCMPAAVPAA